VLGNDYRQTTLTMLARRQRTVDLMSADASSLVLGARLAALPDYDALG